MDEKELRHHGRRNREAKDTKHPKKSTKQLSARAREDSVALTHNVRKHKEKERALFSENSNSSTVNRLTIKSRIVSRGHSSGTVMKEMGCSKDTEEQIQANLQKILQLANDPSATIGRNPKELSKPSKILHRSFKGNTIEQTVNSDTSLSEKENQKITFKRRKSKSIKDTLCTVSSKIDFQVDSKKEDRDAGDRILAKSNVETTKEKNIPYDAWAKSIKKVLKDSTFVMSKGTEYFSEVIEDLQARHEEWWRVMTPPSVRTGISKMVMAMEDDLEKHQEDTEHLDEPIERKEKDAAILPIEYNLVKSSSKVISTLSNVQLSNCPGTTIANPLSYLKRYEAKIIQPMELKEDGEFYENVLKVLQSPSRINFGTLLTEKDENKHAIESKEQKIYEVPAKDKTPPILRTRKRSRAPKTVVINPLDYLQKVENRNDQKNYDNESRSTFKSLTNISIQSNAEHLNPSFKKSSNSNCLQVMPVSKYNPKINQNTNLINSSELLNKPNQNEYSMSARSSLHSNPSHSWEFKKSPYFQETNKSVQLSNNAFPLPISYPGFSLEHNPELGQGLMPNNLKLSSQNQPSKDVLSNYEFLSEQTLRDNHNKLAIQNGIENKNSLEDLYATSKYCQGEGQYFSSNMRPISQTQHGSKSENRFEIQQPGSSLYHETESDYSHKFFDHIPQPVQSLLPSTSYNKSNNEVFIQNLEPERHSKKSMYYTACTPELSGAPSLKLGELILHKRNKSAGDSSSGTHSMPSSQENIYYDNGEKLKPAHTHQTLNFGPIEGGIFGQSYQNVRDGVSNSGTQSIPRFQENNFHDNREMMNPPHTHQTLNFGPIERGIFGQSQQNQQNNFILNNDMINTLYPEVLEQNVRCKNFNQSYPKHQRSFISSNDPQNSSTQCVIYNNSRLNNPQNRMINQVSHSGTFQPHNIPLNQQHSVQNVNDINLQHINSIHPHQNMYHQFESYDIPNHSTAQAPQSRAETFFLNRDTSNSSSTFI